MTAEEEQVCRDACTDTKEKSSDETVETDERSKKKQTVGVAGILVPTVHVGGSSSSETTDTVSAPCRQQRVEVPQDNRSSIEDMEISQLRVKREVREVQGVGLDTDKRGLQRLARNSAEYYFRDK